MKRYLFYILFIIAAISFGACKKLDLAPAQQLSDASFWRQPSDFQLAANDFYFRLGATNEPTRDNNSDITFGAGPNDFSNGSYLPEANSALWDASYEGIRATNYLLQKASESELGAAIDNGVGQGLFFRAYHYWNLVKTYGGVPKIDIVLSTTSEELYTPKATQAEIVDFIIADLDAAAAKLPLQSQLDPGTEFGRATKGAALNLKARAALFQGTWAKFHGEADADKYLDMAISAAEALITSGEYELYDGMGDLSYKNLHILPGDDSKEVILAFRFWQNRLTHNWTRNLWFNVTTPTKALADMYLATDGLPIDKSPLFQGYNTLTSEFQNRDSRMSQTFIVPGTEIFFEGGLMQPTYPGFSGSNATQTGYMVRKFLGETVDATAFAADYDFKEFRYGEVLLILAEALYEKNGSISDGDLDRTINLLRDRVDMAHLTNALVTVNNLDMREEIRRERTVELAFEGFRRDDLRRWKTAETVLPLAIRGVKFEGTEYETNYPDLNIGTDIQVDANGFIIAEPAASRQFLDKQYFDPIPLQQIQLSNGTLEQNPGW